MTTHPFRRLFARIFDSVLALVLLLIAAEFVWGLERTRSAYQARTYAFMFLALLLWAFMEAVLLIDREHTRKGLFAIRVHAPPGVARPFSGLLARMHRQIPPSVTYSQMGEKAVKRLRRQNGRNRSALLQLFGN